MRRDSALEMVDKTAKTFLMIGHQLTPMRVEYDSHDMAEQILYMLTVFETIPVGMDDTALIPVRARMVELIDEAKA